MCLDLSHITDAMDTESRVAEDTVLQHYSSLSERRVHGKGTNETAPGGTPGADASEHRCLFCHCVVGAELRPQT